jgi:light-regulated signal transduction histidine kinase (bacteriophytochrome)
MHSCGCGDVRALCKPLPQGSIRAVTAQDFVVDLTNCDREPIHVPGSIQPHGAMFVCSATERRIAHLSANAAEFIGRPNENLIGERLESAIGDTVVHDLRNVATRSGSAHESGILLGVRLADVAQPIDIATHRYNDWAFVELEHSIDSAESAKIALDLTQTLIRRIGLETTVDALAKAAAKLARAMLNYDRVMVYRFLHNGAGQVIAEARRAGLHSFLGQHFPASDIPHQARRLYMLNTIRMIGDSSFVPVPLVPAAPAGANPIDMSFAQLRSVSPIHCEYLRNMGVGASMSISIIVDGALWGLISCHNDTPKIVPMPLRVGAELFGQYFSLQIAVAERRAESAAAAAARRRLDDIVAGLNEDRPIEEALQLHLENFRNLVACDGVGLWIGGRWSSSGSAPPAEKVDALIDLVGASGASGTIWRTQELRAYGDMAGDIDDIAGVLAIPMSQVARDYLLFFRCEEAHHVEWAGEPVKNRVPGPTGDRLTPRGSFDAWREDVRGRSKPWTDADVAVAEAIRTYLRDIVLRYNELSAEERLRTERRRRILNDELNHRIKNIMALVKSIAMQTGAHAQTVAEYSAALEGRLRALSFAHDQSLADGEGGDLGALIEAEAALHRSRAAPDRVVTKGPSVLLDDRTFGVMALVIHEMMTNAAKYGALSNAEGQLRLEWTLTAEQYCVLSWEESGGPPVQTPTREGFGSKLIHSTIAYDLGGSVELTYAPHGLAAKFVIPARHHGAAADSAAATPTIAGSGHVLDGLRILIVEDQALIAIDMEETLRRMGARDVRLSPNAADALVAIDEFNPDAAVLDFNLGTDTAVDAADALMRRSIPFIFATGYGDSVMIPERMRAIAVLRKPISPKTLAEGLAVLMQNL